MSRGGEQGVPEAEGGGADGGSEEEGETVNIPDSPVMGHIEAFISSMVGHFFDQGFYRMRAPEPRPYTYTHYFADEVDAERFMKWCEEQAPPVELYLVKKVGGVVLVWEKTPRPRGFGFYRSPEWSHEDSMKLGDVVKGLRKNSEVE